jgi:hypothetical protein
MAADPVRRNALPSVRLLNPTMILWTTFFTIILFWNVLFQETYARAMLPDFALIALDHETDIV